MAKLIEDHYGARKIVMEFTEAEAALIKALIGRCNTHGAAHANSPGLHGTFAMIDLPRVKITGSLMSNGNGGETVNLTATKGE